MFKIILLLLLLIFILYYFIYNNSRSIIIKTIDNENKTIDNENKTTDNIINEKQSTININDVNITNIQEEDNVLKNHNVQKNNILLAKNDLKEKNNKNENNITKNISKKMVEKFKNSDEIINDNIKHDDIKYDENVTKKLNEIINLNRFILNETKDNKLKNKKNNNIKDNVINRYYNSLIKELHANNILSHRDIQLLEKKKKMDIINIHNIIFQLEKLKEDIPNYNINPNININEHNSLGDNISNKWDYNFSYLNTDKWGVPLSKPPLCINSKINEKVLDYINPNYTNLIEWDTSRKIFNKT